MESQYKKVVVYDLETGGFSEAINPITEFAAVVIDLSNLEIVDKMSVMFYPEIYTPELIDSKKAAKAIFKNLSISEKIDEKPVTRMEYGNENVTLKTLDSLIQDIESFYTEYHGSKYINRIKLEEIEKINPAYKHLVNTFLNNSYNPNALEVTHMSLDMIKKEGIDQKSAFEKIKSFLSLHKVDNSLPVVAGHNINKFDNRFMEKLFADNSFRFEDYVNDFKIDTYQFASLKWFELPSFNLSTCANEVGVILKDAHRAIVDTEANADFLIKMLENLRGKGGSSSVYVRKKFDMNF